MRNEGKSGFALLASGAPAARVLVALGLLSLAIGAASAATFPPAEGVADPTVTAAQLCTHDTTGHNPWIAAERAKDTYELRDRVYRVYGIPRGHRRGYVVDHAVPLELGGLTVEENLAPQPLAESRRKDRDEHRLHAAVCSGRMTLATAQAEIIRLWGTK